jgi:hypothetical protein
LQNSIVGSPRSFSGRLGAAELGMGHEITNIIPNTSDVMLVFTEKTMSALTGNDSSDFTLAPLDAEQEAGALAFTAQKIGDVIYLDNRGVRSARQGRFTPTSGCHLYIADQPRAAPQAGCGHQPGRVVRRQDQEPISAVLR